MQPVAMAPMAKIAASRIRQFSLLSCFCKCGRIIFITCVRVRNMTAGFAVVYILVVCTIMEQEKIAIFIFVCEFNESTKHRFPPPISWKQIYIIYTHPNRIHVGYTAWAARTLQHFPLAVACTKIEWLRPPTTQPRPCPWSSSTSGRELLRKYCARYRSWPVVAVICDG